MANRTFRVLVAAAAAVLLTACQSATTGTAQAGAGAPTTSQGTETTESSTTDTAATETSPTRVPVVSSATSTASSTATSAPTSTPTTATSAPTTSATAPKTTAPPPGSGDTFPNCVYGDWIASNEWFASAVAQLSGGAAHYISGDVLVTFKPDGTARTHYRKWTNEFVVGDVTMTVVRNGKDTANYTVEEDGSFAMQDVKLSSKLTMTGQSPQGTVRMPTQDPEPVSQTGTFLCVDKLLHIQTADGEMILARPELVEGS